MGLVRLNNFSRFWSVGAVSSCLALARSVQGMAAGESSMKEVVGKVYLQLNLLPVEIGYLGKHCLSWVSKAPGVEENRNIENKKL